MLRASLLALALMFALPAHAAVDPRERLPDPTQESRAREISRDLRCLVCQNQSIDDSNADLARDLRLLVRERIAAGDTNAQVRAFVIARYGEYVLLTPPFNARTAVLWAGPPLVLLIGATIAFFYLRRRPQAASPAPLSAAERARLEKLLKDGPA